jgi:hypothetical protein
MVIMTVSWSEIGDSSGFVCVPVYVRRSSEKCVCVCVCRMGVGVYVDV